MDYANCATSVWQSPIRDGAGAFHHVGPMHHGATFTGIAKPCIVAVRVALAGGKSERVGGDV